MKASIDSKGCLTVSPESPLEDYALSKWLDDWVGNKATFLIQTDHPFVPGAQASREVSPRQPD